MKATKHSHPDIIDNSQVYFSEVSSEQAEKFAALVDGNYTKEIVAGILRALADFIIAHNIGIIVDGKPTMLSVAQATEAKSWKSSVSKAQMVKRIAGWMGCEENLRLYFAKQSSGMSRLYKKIASNGSIDLESARNLAGKRLVHLDSARYFYTSQVAYNEIPWLVTNHARMEMYIRLSMPDGMRGTLFNAIFPPKSIEKMTVKELPTDVPELRVIDAEAETYSLIPVLQNYIKNGVMELGATKMSVVVAKKILRNTGLREFLPAETRDLGVWRTIMLAGTLCQLYKTDKIEVTVRSAISSLAKVNWFDTSGQDIFMHHLLPYYGWRSNIRPISGTVALLSEASGEVFAKVPEGYWMGFQDFLMEFHRTQGSVLLFEFFNGQYYADNIILNKFSDVWVTEGNFKQQAGVPLVQSFMAYLAAIGCAEIAWEDARKGDPSPMSRLRYVRLTPMGRYAYGLTKKFQAPKGEHNDKEIFELSDTHLLLRPLSPENPYLGIVKDFAAPVGAGRYQVNEKTFLNGIKDVTDLKARISVFHELVSETPPSIWEDFFNSLLSKTDAFEPTRDHFSLMKVKEDHTELLKLIATDPELRRMVIRAEHGFILVNMMCKNAVEERLRSFGYLI